MNLRNFARAVLVVALLGLTAGQCENKDLRFVLERMPDHYRACAAKVVVIPDGPLTYKQLLGLLTDLRKSELRQNRCLKGAIAWADAQASAYTKHFN